MHNDTPQNPVGLTSAQQPLVPVAVVIALAVVTVAPRSAPFMLLLLACPIVASARRRLPSISWRPFPQLVITLSILCGYLLLNSLWSVVPITALGRTVLFALIVALGLTVAKTLPLLTNEQIDDVQRAIIGITLTMALFHAVETALGQPIRRFIVSFIPILRPDPKNMTVVDGWVTYIELFTLNRNLAMLNLLLWPTLLLLKTWKSQSKARIVAFILISSTLLAVFNSEHETSMLAIVVGALVLLGMHVAARPVRALIVACWIIATLLVVPAADFAHDRGLHRAEWLPLSARNRIVLWNVTADRTLQTPVFGIGIKSTKPLDQKAASHARVEPGDVYAQRTGRHAHNIFMQIWYELGAAGAILFLVVGLTALRTMSRLPAVDQPFIYASFASTMVTASFSWGLWQPWFMCSFGIWITLLLIALDVSRRSAASEAGFTSETTAPETGDKAAAFDHLPAATPIPRSSPQT